MAWYWIVFLTILIFWTVSIILAQFDEDLALRWAFGLLYPLLYWLCYPIRAIRQYEDYREHYEKHGITKWQFLFGKRTKKDVMQ